MLKKPRYVAICPRCDKHKELFCVPMSDQEWPQCFDCCQSMSIYDHEMGPPTLADGP
jgi:hypothetical protein